jgi:hypothetical protein
MAQLVNGGPGAQLVDPKTRALNSQYIISPQGTAQENWNLVAAINQMTVNSPDTISTLPLKGSYIVYERDFSILDLEALSPGGNAPFVEAYIGDAPEYFLGIFPLMLPTARNRTVVTSNCEPVTGYPTQF